MSKLDNSPLDSVSGIPITPRQDVQSLLSTLRAAAEECRSEDPCLLMAGFFEHLPIPAWVKAVQADGSLIMVHVNRPYTRATGIRAVEYLTQPDHALWESGDAGAFEAEDITCILERRTVPIQGAVPHPDKPGHDLVFYGWKWPIMVGGEAVAVCGVAHITEVMPDV